MPARAVLLDIEGTTTPISFVHDILFPYARAHISAFLETHRDADTVRRDIERLREEHRFDIQQGHAPPPWSAEAPADAQRASALAYLHWLMDRDRKSPALKSLQGQVWHDGYRRGELRGEVFPDVPPALERWHAEGRDVRIYSSGSVLAQQLLFSTTAAGDLTQWLTGFFDTTMGPKTDPESYLRIARAMKRNAGDIVFVSDALAELEAARRAGLATRLTVRPGNAPVPDEPGHPIVESFEQMPL